MRQAVILLALTLGIAVIYQTGVGTRYRATGSIPAEQIHQTANIIKNIIDTQGLDWPGSIAQQF